MIELQANGMTLPRAYHKALKLLLGYGVITDCSDWGCKQLECGMTMHVSHPLAEPRISRLTITGPAELQEYVMEMTDGIKDFEVDAGLWAYTYHQRMADQLGFIEAELKRNPSSRRAAVMIRTADDIGSADPACLQHMQFFIREGRLDLDVLFRSNDAVKATFMNAYALIEIQRRMAERLGVPVGEYTHRANSFHCYEKDFDTLKGYVARMDGRDSGITYYYDGPDGWKEDMDDAIPDILERVEDLKRR